MLLVSFNKIRVHSFHTVLCWFLVSISPFDNYPILNCCVWVGHSVRVNIANVYSVWVTTVRVNSSSRQGLGLALQSKVGVTTVRVSSSRQGRSRGIYVAARGRLGYPEGSATGSHRVPPYWSTLSLGQRSTITTNLS